MIEIKDSLYYMLDCEHYSKNGPQRYIVRLLEYMPGVPLARVVVQLDMLYKLGSLTALMNLTLQDFKPSSNNYFDPDSLWNISNLLKLTPLLEVLNGNPMKKLVYDVLQVCTSSLLPKLPYCRSGPIHGDLNDYNILVEECTEDVNHQTTHMSLVHSPNICPTSEEKDSLFFLVVSRMASSIVLCQHTAALWQLLLLEAASATWQ
uniref:hydroxylysine kinase-like n=1 Tax=Myxine glutinosa TaxID=7769 RepID=UPI00358F0A3F